MTQRDLKSDVLPCPPYKEQQTIASFLDAQCKKIDGIIADTEQQIEVLKQYKTSLITETVTKGLDKSVPMKDSGIEWIGKIPARWEVKRLKYTSKFKTGTTPQENAGINYIGDGFNWYTPSDFDSSLFLVDSERYIETRIIQKDNIKLFREGSVLLIGIGATVGKVAYCNHLSYSNQQVTAIIPDSIAGKYLLYFIKSQEDYIRKNALYTTLPIINNVYLSNILVCLPNEREQKKISDFLDVKCLKIDELIADKQESIETMKSYKKSLIYEYVTGKKRVKI
jgi:type I restriction enzyme S subunit